MRNKVLQLKGVWGQNSLHLKAWGKAVFLRKQANLSLTVMVKISFRVKVEDTDLANEILSSKR